MQRHIRRSALLASVAATTVLGAVACQSDQASVLEPAGSLVFNFPLALTGTNMPRGVVRKSLDTTNALNNTTKIVLSGLQTLKDPTAYQVWLGKPGTGTAITWKKAVGTLKVVSTDTSLNTLGDPTGTERLAATRNNVSSFSLGGARIRDTLVITGASFGEDPAPYTVTLVTVEDDPTTVTDPTASTIRPLWVRLSKATTTSGTFSFGAFNEDPTLQYVYKATGRGTAGVRDNVLIVDDSLLSRPPVGYYYATHLLRAVPNATDTTLRDTATFALGAQHLPYPHRDQSLENADVELIPGYVIDNPPTVLYAGVRLKVDTLTAAGTVNQAQPFAYYRQVLVTLESKKGDPAAGPSPAVVLVGVFTDLISKPKT